MQKQLQQIIDNIDAGLTGDDTKDVEYLHNCAEKYKDEAHQMEIRRHIGRHLAKRLSDEQQKEFSAAYQSDLNRMKQTLGEALMLIKAKDIPAAEKLLADNGLSDGMYENVMNDDTVTTYLEFENPVEEAYYKVKFQPEKRIMDVGLPFRTSYQLAAFIAVENKELDRALRILDTGIKRCPFAADLIFERGEVYKMQNRLPELYKTMTENSSYFYRRGDIAHYFRNIGWYFSSEKDWDAAICCYATSAMWKSHPMVNNELTYIEQESKRPFDDINNLIQDPEQWKAVLAKHSLNIIPVDPLWLELFMYVGEQAETAGQFAYAANCYHLHHDLTESAESKARLEACVAKLPNT
ncbi:MAG: hypothetical protein JST89_00530 [Cyanobacteria bacterium SZAS-4]|nr:hypothetical protein [Cyanobacteria bacterium SZAS-4]